MNETQAIALLYEALIHAEGSPLIAGCGIDVLALQSKLDAIVPQPLGNFDKALLEALEDVKEQTKDNNEDITFNAMFPKKHL